MNFGVTVLERLAAALISMLHADDSQRRFLAQQGCPKS